MLLEPLVIATKAAEFIALAVASGAAQKLGADMKDGLTELQGLVWTKLPWRSVEAPGVQKALGEEILQASSSDPAFYDNLERITLKLISLQGDASQTSSMKVDLRNGGANYGTINQAGGDIDNSRRFH